MRFAGRRDPAERWGCATTLAEPTLSDGWRWRPRWIPVFAGMTRLVAPSLHFERLCYRASQQLTPLYAPKFSSPFGDFCGNNSTFVAGWRIPVDASRFLRPLWSRQCRFAPAVTGIRLESTTGFAGTSSKWVPEVGVRQRSCVIETDPDNSSWVPQARCCLRPTQYRSVPIQAQNPRG